MVNVEFVMKTLIAFIGLLVCELFALGQGSVIFANTSSTLISTNAIVGGPAAGIISGGVRSYYFSLFTASLDTIDPSLFTFTGHYATNIATSGRLGSAIAVAIPNAQELTTVAMLVRGWSANIGVTYSAVTNYLSNPSFAGWYGESAIANVTLGALDVGSPLLFGTTVGRIPGFTLEMYTVPEPSSLVLVGLGVAALWFFCRRSASLLGGWPHPAKRGHARFRALWIKTWASYLRGFVGLGGASV
jgi:hypothetical protein